MILALASVVNYDRQSDAPIWSITSSGVNYNHNKFIIQATGLNLDADVYYQYCKYSLQSIMTFYNIACF